MLRIVFAFVCSVVGFAGSAEAEDVRFRITGVQEQAFTNRAIAVLREVYARLDIEFDVFYLSAARSLHEVENGYADGEAARIKEVGDHFTQIVVVNVPLFSLEIFGYFRDDELTGLPLSEFGSHRVGHVVGARFAENLTRSMPEVQSLESSLLLFNMLQTGRIDIAIVAEEVGDELLRKGEFADLKKGHIPIQSLEFYHFVNRRHSSLVPRLERAVREVIAETEAPGVSADR